MTKIIGLLSSCIVQSATPKTSRTDEEQTIEQKIVEEAAILTGIGVSTAIGLLVLLVVVISLTGRLGRRFLGWASIGASEVEHNAYRNKARAAVIAVTALQAERRPGSRRQLS